MSRIKMLVFCCLFMSMFTACANKSDSNSSEESITIEGENGQKYRSYQEACRAGDFEAAHLFLDRINNAKVGPNEEYKYSWEKYAAIGKAKKEIFKYEMNYLVSQNTTEANNRLIYLLNEESMPTPINEGAVLEYEYHHRDYNESGRPYQRVFDTYSEWVNDRNSKCDLILDFCILTNNEDLAKKILLLFRQDVISVKKNLSNDGYEFKAHYTDDSIKKAKQKYNEAVKSGAFK